MNSKEKNSISSSDFMIKCLSSKINKKEYPNVDDRMVFCLRRLRSTQNIQNLIDAEEFEKLRWSDEKNCFEE